MFNVSSKLLTALEIFAIITVRQFPPRESFRRRVNFERECVNLHLSFIILRVNKLNLPLNHGKVQTVLY